MSPELLIPLMFAALVIGIFSGIHVAFVLGGLAVVFGLLGWGPQSLPLISLRIFELMKSYPLSAIPLFVLMGYVLESSGLGAEIFKAAELYFRRIRGGLAIGTIVGCAVFGMMTGLVASAVILAGILTIPEMFKRGYNKEMVLGTVAAGGTLGILIPPSVMLIFYASEAGASTGGLFAGAFVPGFLLAGLYALYIYVRCKINPELAPMPETRERVPVMDYVRALKVLFPVSVIILSVLGVIVFAVATPTEAAGTGAFATLLLAAIYRRLKWRMLKEACLGTLQTLGMLGLMLMMVNAFAVVFLGMGGKEIITDLIVGLAIPPLGILLVMLSMIFVLGMFLDFIGIMYILIPIYVVIIPQYGWDPIWFALLFCVTMQTAWLTPPFGYSLFYLRAITPPEITFAHIIRGCAPFIGLQLIGLGILIAFPQLILWLPRLVGY